MSVSVCGSLGCYCSLWFPRDSTALIRSGSYTRRRWDDDLKNSEGSASTNRTPSYQRRLASAAIQNAKLPSLILPSDLCSIWSDVFIHYEDDLHSFGTKNLCVEGIDSCLSIICCTFCSDYVIRDMYVHASMHSSSYWERLSLSLPQSLLHDCTCPVRLLCHWVCNTLLRHFNKPVWLPDKSKSQGCSWHKT